jgi:hypothetical protein
LRCGADLKWRRVRHRWPDLSADLRRAVLRDLRDALITIVAPSLYRFDLQQSIESTVRFPRDSWPPAFQQWVDGYLDAYERESILWDSPALAIQNLP